MTTDPYRCQRAPDKRAPPFNRYTFNPYTINPDTVTCWQDRPWSRTVISGQVSTQSLVIGTIAGITASGGFFGIVLIIGGMLTLAPSDANAAQLVTSAMVGCFAAFFGSLAIVPLVSAASRFVRTPASRWSASGIQMFAATCGFLTGYACVPLLYGSTLFLYGSTLWSAAAGLVPGAVGAIGTAVAVIPLAQRAKITWPPYQSRKSRAPREA